MSDAGVVRLLLFRVGNLLCATEAERVREILPRLEPTRIPGAPPVVAGIVNVRGTLVTVVEGWRALRQAAPAPPLPPAPASGSAPGPAPAPAPASDPMTGGGAGGGGERVGGEGGDVAGTTVLLELDGGKKVLGFTVDEVVDLLSVGGEALERRQALPGIDPTLVRAVGRRAGQLFVVLDTDALLTPILSS